MTEITSEMLADMHARRLNGESVAEIAVRYNVTPMSAYQRLRRKYGLENYSTKPELVAANDNHPDRVTRMSPRNGGCSTTSGMMPVTLKRVPSVDGMQVAA